MTTEFPIKEGTLEEFDLKSTSLVKAVFHSDLPEAFVKKIPAQSLHMAIRANGLDSSLELLQIVSPEQYRVLLDFEFWNKDNFVEENFWTWLVVSDENKDLKDMQRFLSFIDLKLVSILISRYLHVITGTERTDQPPAAHYYTPDQGYTWIHIKIPDSERHKLFGKFLALIFQFSSEIFYRLLTITQTHTESMLEEEAYQDKLRRLADEGIPTFHEAMERSSPLGISQALKIFDAKSSERPSLVVPVVSPLIFDPEKIEPLDGAIQGLKNNGNVQLELSYLMNSAIVYWGIPTYEYDAVQKLLCQVKGAINIGLELILANRAVEATAALEIMGVRNLYRLGFSFLVDLRKFASAHPDDKLQLVINDQITFAVLAGAREKFPEVPLFFEADGNFSEVSPGKLKPGYRAISSKTELEAIRNYLIEKLEQVAN